MEGLRWTPARMKERIKKTNDKWSLDSPVDGWLNIRNENNQVLFNARTYTELNAYLQGYDEGFSKHVENLNRIYGNPV